MKLFIRYSLSQIYCLIVVMLFACNTGNLGTNNSNLISSTVPLSASKITIDNVGTVPVFADTATSSIIYIHNNSNEVINNIDYSISNNLGINSFSIDVNGCDSIAANSRCALKFTTPVLSATNVQGSSVLKASYNGNSFSQIINYNQILDNSASGIIVSSGVNINNYGNQSGYAMVYAYAGSGKSYLLKKIEISSSQVNIMDNYIDKNVQINQILPIEISSNSSNNVAAKLIINSTIQTNVYSTNVSIAVIPSNNGAILISGTSPIIDTKVSLLGSFPIMNAGNMMATLDPITYPEGIESASGPNSCGTTLEPYTSCNIYFKVPYYGGNGNIIIPYNGISLTQAIVWYNSGGTGALLAMSSSASQINIPYGTTILTITVRVKNIGAYPLNNVTPSSVTISGNANTTITNNLCNGTLKIESSCSYQVDVTDTVIESNKQINLGISGTYNNGSSQLYSRILPIQYNSLSLWIWMSGESDINQYGVYGIKGIASPSNIPGGREGAISWTDSLGNLWLFGGRGYVGTQVAFFNDLWKYEISTNTWTWMSGESKINPFGDYGTKGVASSTNMPGSRDGSVSWTDESGNLWLFGGYGYSATQISFLNDLWKYDISTNTWTWMSGESQVNQFGNYGTKGVASSTNMPGSRNRSASWTDESGNFWLFGGYGYSANQISFLNDLWKYDIYTNTWTWVSGGNQINQFGNYGIKGVASSTNMPGSRDSLVSWKDGSGNLWIFGGYGYGATQIGFLNDGWKYDISTNTWTWMSGESQVNQFGDYGTKGIVSVTNMPGSRSNTISWKDSSGNLWIFGGYGYGATESGSLNDLWKYEISTNTWTWMNDENDINQFGTYNAKGIASDINMPGGRDRSVSWTDKFGNLWLFGGNGYDASQNGSLNDLWKYCYY